MTAAIATTTPSSYSSTWSLSSVDIIRGEKSLTVPYKDFLESQIRTAGLSNLDRKKRRSEHSSAKIEIDRKRAELKMGKSEDKELTKYREALKISCSLIYERALTGSLPFILGGEELRSDHKEAISIILNFGILSGETNAAKDCIRRSTTNLETGSVLCDGSWSVFKNDCVILGIIHAARPCFVARFNTKESKEPTPTDLSKDLWDPKLKRPRVLGREIVMLHAAGYIQVASEEQIKRYGHKFVPKDAEAVKKVTLSELLDAVDDKLSSLSLEKIALIMAPYTKKSPVALSIASPSITNAAGAASGGAGTGGSSFSDDGF